MTLETRATLPFLNQCNFAPVCLDTTAVLRCPFLIGRLKIEPSNNFFTKPRFRLSSVLDSTILNCPTLENLGFPKIGGDVLKAQKMCERCAEYPYLSDALRISFLRSGHQTDIKKQ